MVGRSGGSEQRTYRLEDLFIGVISEYQMGSTRSNSWAKAERNGQRSQMRKQAGARGVAQWDGGGRGERVEIDRR